MSGENLGLSLTAAIALLGLIFAGFKWVQAEVRAAEERQSRLRHDLANRVQVMEGDLDRLGRETVKVEEFREHKTELGRRFEKVEAKLEMVAEKLSPIPLLQDQSARNGQQLEKILNKLEGRNI